MEKITDTNPKKGKEEIEAKVKPETETTGIRVVREALEALNTGDVSRVHEFISPEYFNHESQVDPVRSKLRGPEEFIDTVKNLRNAFADLHYEEQETIENLYYCYSFPLIACKNQLGRISLFFFTKYPNAESNMYVLAQSSFDLTDLPYACINFNAVCQ